MSNLARAAAPIGMDAAGAGPRVVLIAHGDAPLHVDGFARWIPSWATLAGLVIVDEPAGRVWQRLKRERRRVGWLRLLDVAAFRLYYRLVLAARDRRWLSSLLTRLHAAYGPVPAWVPAVRTPSPNSREAEALIREAAPDVVIALCKNLLHERIFSIPRHGTFVLHPGICPEYRNAHGCFWALARGDYGKVGMSLVRIDGGIDTGPVFGYFTTAFDETAESHLVIQHRMVFDNLTGIAERLQDVVAGTAMPIPTAGRASAEWGQPWLSRHLQWKWRARRKRRCAQSYSNITT